MKFDIPDTIDTGVLAALSPAAFALLKPHLHYREFERGAVLWEAGDIVDRIFFPHSGLISLIIPNAHDHRVEVANVSCRNASHVPDLAHHPDEHGSLSAARYTTAGVGLIAGRLSFIAAKDFIEAATQHGEIASLGHFCNDWLLLQSQHLAICNATHSADQRLCRWLLLASTQLGTDIVTVTQDELATLLGLNRTTAALIMRRLARAGVLDHLRGRVIIRDRVKLRAYDCCLGLSRPNWPATRLETLHAASPSRPGSIH